MGDESPSQRPRKAVGPDRPSYLGEVDVDRLMAIILALASEVASLRQRLDSHERVSETGTPPSLALVENYAPDAKVEAEREAWRDAYIHRIFRVVMEDVEALSAKNAASD